MAGRAFLILLLILGLLLPRGAATAAALGACAPHATVVCGCCGTVPRSATPTLGQPAPLCCHAAPGDSQFPPSAPATLPPAGADKEFFSAHVPTLPTVGTWLDVLPPAQPPVDLASGSGAPGCGGHDGFGDSGRARGPAPRARSGILLI